MARHPYAANDIRGAMIAGAALSVGAVLLCSLICITRAFTAPGF
jgi:hypothetical protein